MFEGLSTKLSDIFNKLRGYGKLTEENISESLEQVKVALLEADVNYKIVKDFIDKVKTKAVGETVLKSVTPGQQIIKIVYDELTSLMGQNAVHLKTANIPPMVIMIVGLQGSGKTTFCGKLANYLKFKGRKPLLVAADIYRPAAIEQLETHGKNLSIPVLSNKESKDAVKICFSAIDYSRKNGLDTAILDTAGRLHIDNEMMNELITIKNKIKPHEILYVADSMTGQDAVNSATEFLKKLDFDGVVLTKLDGDTRGGAALSIKSVTGRPIKFVSSSEKLDSLDQFYPDRMAGRILGMGDIVSLVEKAQQSIDEEKAKKLEQKLRKLEFTLEDFYDQLQQIKKMGSVASLMSMIPGMGNSLTSQQMEYSEKEMKKTEAIINSMTIEERRKPKILDGSRRLRIAKGSGTQVQDVNRLIKNFESMQKMMKKMMKPGSRAMQQQFMSMFK
jgi:signal recognition particle subunit SRP54